MGIASYIADLIAGHHALIKLRDTLNVFQGTPADKVADLVAERIATLEAQVDVLIGHPPVGAETGLAASLKGSAIYRPAVVPQQVLWKVIVQWGLTDKAIRLLEGIKIVSDPLTPSWQFKPPDTIVYGTNLESSGFTEAHEVFHAYFWRKWMLPVPALSEINGFIADNRLWVTSTIGAAFIEAIELQGKVRGIFGEFITQPIAEGRSDDPDHLFVRTAIELKGKLNLLPSFMKPWYGGLFTGKPLELA